MAAAYSDIYLEQGTDYNNRITLDDINGVPYNLTNFTITAQAKTSYYAANASIIFDASVYDANNGIIQLSANSYTTSSISAWPNLVYDVKIVDPDGLVTRIVEGRIFISPKVS